MKMLKTAKMLTVAAALFGGLALDAFAGSYSDSANVTAAAGSVQFTMSLPSTGTYGFNTSTFSTTAGWLTWASSPSINNNTAYLTLNYGANTTGAARSATFTGAINGTTVSLTVNQAVGSSSPVVVPVSSTFGPGNVSEFYISASTKARVVGVYGLEWQDFTDRGDGFRAFTDPRIVDREKLSGISAADHTFCLFYSIANAMTWTGWAQELAGITDEDVFAQNLIAAPDPSSYILGLMTGSSIGDFQRDIAASTGFLGELISGFSAGDAMMITGVYFPNYNWYGTVDNWYHGLDCCGYAYDTTKAATDPTALKGLFIIDPDNDREVSGGGASAPDRITYCPVEWVGDQGMYKITGVFGAEGWVWPYNDGSTYFLETHYQVAKQVSTSEYKVQQFARNVPAEQTTFAIHGVAGSSCGEPWIHLSATSDGFSVLVDANTGVARSGYIYCYEDPGCAAFMGVVTINQAAGSAQPSIPGSNPSTSEYGDSANVTAAAGSTQFTMALPSTGTYGFNTALFSTSADWLTWVGSPSINNNTAYLTLSYDANTTGAARSATFTGTINGTSITLTINQAGSAQPESKAAQHDFGNLNEELSKIQNSGFAPIANKKTYSCVVRNDESWEVVAGIVVTVNKTSASGTSKIKATVQGLDGKKTSSKQVPVAIPASGSLSASLDIKGWGALELSICDNDIAGRLGGYTVLGADLGGTIGTNGEGTFLLGGNLELGSSFGTLYDEFLPDGEEFKIQNSKWVFAKAATVKYKKGELDWNAYDAGLSKGKTNNAGLRLSYNAKQGTFKGTFKAYSDLDGKLKKTTISVTGIVLDGYGYGIAVEKKTGVKVPVYIE